MAVLRSLLAAVITCVAVIQSVAGAPAVKPFVSFTETMTSTVDLPNTTFTTTLTITEAEGWGEQPPSLASDFDTLPAHMPGHDPSLEAIIAVERANSSASAWVNAPMATVTATVDGPDLPVTTNTEHRDNIQDMTLSLGLTASTTSRSLVLGTTIFPYPGIFGHLPPVETAITKFSSWTTPDFPLVPSVLPDGTKLGRRHVAVNTPGLSSTAILPDLIIEGTTTDSSPIYGSHTSAWRSHKPSSSDNCPGEFGILPPPPSGGRSHRHSSYTSWPRTCLATNRRPITLRDWQEILLTETSQPLPLHTWNGEAEDPKQVRRTIEGQSSYTFGTSIPDFRTLTPAPTSGEGTSTARQVSSTKFITQTAVRCPTDLPGPPQSLSEGWVSLVLETSLLEGTVSRGEASRTPMAAPTDSTIASSIEVVTASAVLPSSKIDSSGIISNFVTVDTTQPFSSEIVRIDNTAVETVHWVTITTIVTCTTCGPCSTTETTQGSITVAHTPLYFAHPR